MSQWRCRPGSLVLDAARQLRARFHEFRVTDLLGHGHRQECGFLSDRILLAKRRLAGKREDGTAKGGGVGRPGGLEQRLVGLHHRHSRSGTEREESVYFLRGSNANGHILGLDGEPDGRAQGRGAGRRIG